MVALTPAMPHRQAEVDRLIDAYRDWRVPVRRIVMLHRNARRRSPTYWRHLAAQAEKTGRHALARTARVRAATLAAEPG